MEILKKSSGKRFTLRAIFEEDKKNEIIKEMFYITDFIDKKESYIYLGKKEKYSREIFKKAVNKIVGQNVRDLEILIDSFVQGDIVRICRATRVFVTTNYYQNGNDLYSAKTSKKEEPKKIILVTEQDILNFVENALILSKYTNLARKYQAMPPNICNSEFLAKEMETILKQSKNKDISYKILDKSEITKEKMELFLSVNKGSAFEARLVVAEYKGDPQSKEKIAYIGKGITFDSGGYNLKPSASIQGMKYDMSGAAICFSSFMAITELKPKINISIVLPLTDNKISSDANLPDSIWKSMNGKTVEINNTDAEGRLVLADAITYAIRKMNATQLVDVATLTGAILISLGKTFTGGWSTCDQNWKILEKAGIKHDELLWRMPFHDDFLENIKKSNFADLKNTDLTGKGGSISAAMFLKEFTEDKSYIHLDIAGTGGDGENPTGVLVKTLTEYAIIKSKNIEGCEVKNESCQQK
ncbi:MAG: M17 family metallopeptidase [Metamycoplasmataceae bacterium]